MTKRKPVIDSPDRKIGEAERIAGCLLAAMEGRPWPESEEWLLPYAAGRQGTANMKKEAGAAGLYARSFEVRRIAAANVTQMLKSEVQRGPRHWELLCSDPHEGMYLSAAVAIIDAAQRYPEQAALQATLLGQELRIADLVATDDGDVRGLPGMRAPAGPRLSRIALQCLRTEVRKHQGFDLVHRGQGGRPRSLESMLPSGHLTPRDVAFQGAALWMRRLLAMRVPEAREALLDGLLSPTAPLPPRLRLGLTVHRWDSQGYGGSMTHRSPMLSGGTLAVLDDPGPEHRHEYVKTGSGASKRSADHDEDPQSWVLHEWATHRLTTGECWETPPPIPPADAATTRIDGVK